MTKHEQPRKRQDTNPEKSEQGFDFSSVEIVDSAASDFKPYHIFNKFHAVTDIPELVYDPKCGLTTVQKRGYWEADRYFTMHLQQELTKLGFLPLNDDEKIRVTNNGLCYSYKDANGLIGQLRDSLVFLFSSSTDLKQPMPLANFEEEYTEQGKAVLENMPILVFMHYDGPITVSCDNWTFELDLEAYYCRKDAFVFKGLFKAHYVEHGKYRLEPIFDKYVFNVSDALEAKPVTDDDWTPSVEVKYKSSYD